MNALCPPTECKFDLAFRHIDSPIRDVRDHAEDVLMSSPKPEHIAALRIRRHMRWSTPDSECRLPQFSNLRDTDETPGLPVVAALTFVWGLTVTFALAAILALLLVKHIGERADLTTMQATLPEFREWDGSVR